jgi:hypothetical protein
MYLIALPGVKGEYHVWPVLADDLRKLTSKRNIHLHLAVRMPKKRYLLHTKNMCRRQLLRLPSLGQLRSRGGIVVAAFIAAGGEDIVSPVAVRDESSYGSGTDKFGVIRMGKDRHNAGTGVGFLSTGSGYGHDLATPPLTLIDWLLFDLPDSRPEGPAMVSCEYHQVISIIVEKIGERSSMAGCNPAGVVVH